MEKIWKLTQDKSWNTLEKKFDWVEDMKEVPQHKIHHKEGNVATHTQMVLDELTKSEEYKSLSEQDQEILWVSALLHDVEKRSTSLDEGFGKVSANGHARRGEYTAVSYTHLDVYKRQVL